MVYVFWFFFFVVFFSFFLSIFFIMIWFLWGRLQERGGRVGESRFFLIARCPTATTSTRPVFDHLSHRRACCPNVLTLTQPTLLVWRVPLNPSFMDQLISKPPQISVISVEVSFFGGDVATVSLLWTQWDELNYEFMSHRRLFLDLQPCFLSATSSLTYAQRVLLSFLVNALFMEQLLRALSTHSFLVPYWLFLFFFFFF